MAARLRPLKGRGRAAIRAEHPATPAPAYPAHRRQGPCGAGGGAQKKITSKSVSQQFEHRLGGLLGLVEVVYEIALSVAVDEDVLGRRDEAVFDAAVARDAVLVGAGVKEAEVKGLGVGGIVGGEVYLAFVDFGVVVVRVVATEAADIDAAVVVFPLVDGQQDEALAYAPGVGEGGHEGVVDHVPHFGVVLAFLGQYGEDGGAAFAYGILAELGEDIGFGHVFFLAGIEDVVDDFADHVFVVELEAEGVAYGHTAADVDGVEVFALFAELAVEFDGLFEFAPVVEGIPDAGIDEEVEHAQAEFGVAGDALAVEVDDVGRADAEAGGIELEVGFFFGGYADAEVAYAGDVLGVVFYLVEVIADGDDVFKAVVDEVYDAAQVVFGLEAVADDDDVFIDLLLAVEAPDEIDVEGRGGFYLGIVVDDLVEHIAEVAAFGAIAVVVLAAVTQRSHSPGEEVAGLFHLRTNLGQIGKLKGSTVLFDEVDQRNAVEREVTVFEVKTILGKVEGLIDQVGILIGHWQLLI